MDAVESERIEDARRILGLLAEPARLRVVAAVVLGYTTTDDIAYRESEVNSALVAFHEDVAALRRYLVDEGLLSRERGIYWRVGGSFSVD
jgi:hypothetical protein